MNGIIIKAIRVLHGMTCKDFAESLSVSPKYVSNMECNCLSVSPNVISKINSIYGISHTQMKDAYFEYLKNNKDFKYLLLTFLNNDKSLNKEDGAYYSMEISKMVDSVIPVVDRNTRKYICNCAFESFNYHYHDVISLLNEYLLIQSNYKVDSVSQSFIKSLEKMMLDYLKKIINIYYTRVYYKNISFNNYLNINMTKYDKYIVEKYKSELIIDLLSNKNEQEEQIIK